MAELSLVSKPVARSRLRGVLRSIAAIRADRTGGVAIVFALSLPAIVGFAGLGTESASWYLTRRTMQGAADTAASTAAAALAAGTSNFSALQSEARSIAATYNFVDGTNNTTVTVNKPPSSGTYQGSSDAVEVSISRQEPALLSALFLSHGPTISVRSVARVNPSLTGEACVVALDKNNETAMTTSGNVSMEFPGCSLYVNSPNVFALNMNGGATIHPNIAYIVGGYSGELTTENGTYLGVDPLIDPYSTATVPAYSGCNSNNYKLVAGKTDTISIASSGVYVFCKGLELEGNSSLTLGPGTFIISGSSNNQGQLKIASNATLTATGGTTIILTGDTTNICGTMATANIAGGATVNLVAPSTGSLAGIAIYQDRACNNHALSNKVAGGTTQSIKGAIYFPEQPVDFAGGSATGGAQCTHLVAWKISFVGNSTFKNNCADAGTRKLQLTGGRLVE